MVFADEKRRKNFTLKTKRVEWLKAAGEVGKKPLLQYLAYNKIPKLPKSKCRECKTPLIWGERSYEFDHKNNNNSNNSQNNCYLVCRNCHGKNTKLKVVKKGGFLGEVVGHKAVKLKVGYKKSTVRKPAKKKTRRKPDSLFDF